MCAATALSRRGTSTSGRSSRRARGLRSAAADVVALFTVWSPQGWRTDRGLRIDDTAARIAGLYGPLLRVDCGTYAVLTLRRGRTTTSVYVVDERVWGFGLSRLAEPTCR